METLTRSLEHVDREISESAAKYKVTFESISRIKGAEKYDIIIDLVEDIIKDSGFARWSGDAKKFSPLDGYSFRVYNGEYWELCYSKDIVTALQKHLRKGGIPMVLQMKLEKKMTSTVINVIRSRILRPRLTLMCFRNGVVDFTESKLTLHRFDRRFDVVKQYDFDFDMKAEAILWKNFLGEPFQFKVNPDGVLPELQKRRQLQMFLGAMLIDRRKIKFEHFMILQGSGSNGKGVIFQVVQGLFGSDEVNSLEVSSLKGTGDEKLRAAATLDGKRILYCPEEEAIRSARHLSFLKSIVSGEPISMRFLGQDVATVMTPPIIMFNTNHRFKTSDFFNNEDAADISMLRRVKIVNFEKTIPTEKRDTMLAERLLHEKAGIFAWIVKGFFELKKNRYRMPESVQGEIDLILEKAKNDVEVNGSKISGLIALYFQRKKTVPEDNGTGIRVDIPFSQIYNNYVDFCRREGLEFATSNKLGRDMGIMGFQKTKDLHNKGNVIYKVYCYDPAIANEWALTIPSLVDDVKATIFEGIEDEDVDEEVYIE